MNNQTHKYFSDLAKRRWGKPVFPDKTPEVAEDLATFGRKGGEVGGNTFSLARRQAFARGNAARWLRHYSLRGLRYVAPSNNGNEQT